MTLARVTSGSNVPHDVNAIIEIASKSAPIKYEVDKKSGAMFVDRFLSTCMYYPCEYGYIPNTLAEDGDPTDILVICPLPLTVGSVIRVRPIGMLNMTDESGIDKKILTVPIDKLTPLYSNIQTIDDLPRHLLDQITHFFSHYKDLDANKWVKVESWVGPEEAKKEILASIKRYDALEAAEL